MKVADGARRLKPARLYRLPQGEPLRGQPSQLGEQERRLDRLKILIRSRPEPLELLRVTRGDPGEPAGPGGEGGVSLLRRGIAVAPVGHVEDRFVDRPSPLVPAIATGAEVDVVACRRLRVGEEAFEEGYPEILLSHENVAEVVGDRHGTHRPDRVRKERVRPVEGVGRSRGRRGYPSSAPPERPRSPSAPVDRTPPPTGSPRCAPQPSSGEGCRRC
jgi:hypothetical protein